MEVSGVQWNMCRVVAERERERGERERERERRERRERERDRETTHISVAGQRDYRPINTTVTLANNSFNGDTACASIPLIDNQAYHDRRSFKVHFLILEQDARGIRIHRRYAWVYILNDDGEGAGRGSLAVT